VKRCEQHIEILTEVMDETLVYSGSATCRTHSGTSFVLTANYGTFLIWMESLLGPSLEDTDALSFATELVPRWSATA